MHNGKKNWLSQVMFYGILDKLLRDVTQDIYLPLNFVLFGGSAHTHQDIERVLRGRNARSQHQECIGLVEQDSPKTLKFPRLFGNPLPNSERNALFYWRKHILEKTTICDRKGVTLMTFLGNFDDFSLPKLNGVN